MEEMDATRSTVTADLHHLSLPATAVPAATEVDRCPLVADTACIGRACCHHHGNGALATHHAGGEGASQLIEPLVLAEHNRVPAGARQGCL